MLYTEEDITNDMLERAARHRKAELALGAFIRDLGDLTGHILLVTLPKDASGNHAEVIRDQLHDILPSNCKILVVANDVAVEEIEAALDRLKRGDRYRP